MSDYHEPYELLEPKVRDIHRALISLKEEIEAIDWYSQRIALCEDPELCSVLRHARNEEVEHACLALEWLRRNMPEWDIELRKRLFKADLAALDGDDEHAAAGGAERGEGLRIAQHRTRGA